MSEIRFSPISGQVSDYILNHPTASPFGKHNISFRVGSHYLQDFSDSGVKNFIKQSHNRNSRNDLDFKEVSTFIQSVASNAPQMAGATFDLADPELGLFKNDKIKADHIAAGFTVESKGNLPSQGVVFFDATASRFPLLEAEKAIETAQKTVEKARDKVKDAQGEVKDAQYLRTRLVDFLGQDSVEELLQKEAKVHSLRDRLVVLDQDKGKYSQELKQLEEEHTTQPANPPSGLSQEARWKKMQELKRALRGLGAETKETQEALKKTEKSISSKQGPLSFMGVGNSLSELRERLDKVNKADDQLHQANSALGQANAKLDQAKETYEKLKKGEGVPAAPAPKPPEAAPQPPVPPAQPPQPPVASSPPAAPKLPSLPPQPVAQPPVQAAVAETSPTPVEAKPPQPPAPGKEVTPDELAWAQATQEKVMNGHEPTPEEIARFDDIMARYIATAKPEPAPTTKPETSAAPVAEPTAAAPPAPAGELTEAELKWAQELEQKVSQGYEPPADEVTRYEGILARYNQQTAKPQPSASTLPLAGDSAPPTTPPPRQPEEVFVPGYNARYSEDDGSQVAAVTPQAPPAPIAPAPQTASVPGNPPAQTFGSYTVKRGDTLSTIARKELGNARRWTQIRDMNLDVIGTHNTHWIFPGQLLKMPQK